ncbi:MAG: hypothetical protein KAU48_07385 [Candidatus Thorarchaeota archaeon]|nr:hypothetical protein [Candidatus Thorarchaeota archaeon]
MRYNKGHHPAYAWGMCLVFIGVVFIFVVVMTEIIPQSLQPPILILAFAAILIGGPLGISGGFKSFDRGAYPIMIAILLIPVIVVIIWYLTK